MTIVEKEAVVAVEFPVLATAENDIPPLRTLAVTCVADGIARGPRGALLTVHHLRREEISDSDEAPSRATDFPYNLGYFIYMLFQYTLSEGEIRVRESNVIFSPAFNFPS